MGQGPGVVLVNGIGDDATSAQWVEVQSALADHARVCRYDRLGTGRSDAPNTAGRAADQLDEELDAVVDLAAKDAPVIVVAHSFGGYLSRVYADRHPDRVRALVFVDALDPSVGVLAGTGASTTADVEMADEQLDLKELEGAVQSVAHLAEDPVVIVVSRGEGATDAWTEGQQRLAALSSRSTLVVVPEVGHQIPSEDPVAVVTAVDDAIRATQ
ncbi:alpha/beta fold hydrolase [Arthrobacter sp. MDT3-44]